jgi:hypothetical protein
MRRTKLKLTREEMWMAHYDALKTYLEEHRQLPDKKQSECRNLLNWWKYNKKCAKAGKLSAEKKALLAALNDMRRIKRVDASAIFHTPK